jgi:ACS family tartrate transporter-like MFS transporter
MTDLETLRAKEIEASVMRKILTRLTPFLAVLYTFNILDRNNISIAALTMKDALSFSDKVYGLGAGMFFIGYFFFEVPSNLIMERVGARRWIARIMLTWGLVSTSMMFVRTPASFYAIRCLLGLAEAGFYPGIILYLTYWAPASARARVISRFLALTAIIGLFGGPWGGQLLRLNGYLGLAGWQWLFLLEGLPSILLSFVVYRYMPDGPMQAAWLTQEEKVWITERLKAEAQEHRGVKHLSFRVAFSDPRIVLMCLIFFLTSTGGNAVGFFGPQLLKDRSHHLWSDTFVASIGIIPALVGAIAMSVAARHSDRTGRRRRHVTVGYMVAAFGYLICVYAPTASWTVVGMAVNALGERIAAGSYWALTSTLMGARAAAGGIALINSVGNLGGFFGPTLMGELKNQAHGGYAPGLYVATILFCVAALLPFLLRLQSPDNTAASEAVSVATTD